MKHRFLSKRYWNDISTPMGECDNLLYRFDDIIDFSLGDPDLTTDVRIINAAFTDALNGHTHYTDFYGYKELREEICLFYKEEYNFSYAIEECIVTTSGCQAMWLVMEAILDDGDEVIIHSPYFTPYPQQIKLARGNPIILDTYEEDGFQIDPLRLDKLITNRTKAIVINTPCNPTGACFSLKTLESIASIAKERDLIIIADDIYTAFSYREPFVPISTLEDMKERTITIGSFSKNFLMTGWRIGYILAPDFITDTVKNINDNNVFTAPSISQRAALYALRNRRQVQTKMLEEYKSRIDYAFEKANRIKNMSALYPMGGLYVFANIKKTGLTSSEVVDRILEEAHVLTLPGDAFGQVGEGYIRLAVTVGKEKIDEAFKRISRMSIFS